MSLSFDIRDIRAEDVESYYYWKRSIHKHNALDGPYYKTRSDEELKKYIEKIKVELEKGNKSPIEGKKLVVNGDEIIGEVNWYWKSEETLWMEIGIVIFDENNWGKGYGRVILKQWINQIFCKNPKLVRLGLTTWSGNIGMMKLAEKLGMKKEAEYRKARIVEGKYYDSISFGILREEWNGTSKN